MALIDPNYIDRGELREQDMVSLQEYLAASDRAIPDRRRGMPFFSGREAELGAFRCPMIERMVRVLAVAPRP